MPMILSEAFNLVSNAWQVKHHLLINKWLIQPYLSVPFPGIQNALHYYLAIRNVNGSIKKSSITCITSFQGLVINI